MHQCTDFPVYSRMQIHNHRYLSFSILFYIQQFKYEVLLLTVAIVLMSDFCFCRWKLNVVGLLKPTRFLFLIY